MSKDSFDFVNLCGFDIYAKSSENCLNEIFSKEKVHVVSGNPEVLYTAMNDEVLQSNLLSEQSFIIPDGIGVKVAAKLNGLNIVEKIAGVELMISIISRCELEGKSIYLLGASEDSLCKCKSSILNQFPKLIISGASNGFFESDDVSRIVNDIVNAKPYAVFVAMGCPKQEKFIINNMENIPASIYMGVGGSFDVIGGVKKRAPKIMISFGMEWLYRAYKEPFRVAKLSLIPKFIIKSILCKS